MRFLIPILFLFPACVTQPLSTDAIYRKDIKMQVNRTWGNVPGEFLGTGILEKNPSYDFNFYFYRKPTKFTLTSCHREIVWNNPGNGVKYTYVPVPDLEQNEYCPIEVGAFDDKGQHAWGMFDFKSGAESLDASLTCNGDINLLTTGVSICQSKAKLVQKIEFTEPVKVSVSNDCPEVETKDNKVFLITMGREKCLYLFKRDSQYHRLITFGYDDVILR